MLFFDAHTHTALQSKNTVAIENKYPNSLHFTNPFSIGMHPWCLKKETIKNHLLLVEQRLQDKNCYAIGECGLDKNSTADFKLQQQVFIEHIQLSEQYNKPIIIHCVKAYQELIALKKQHSPKQFWIVHGFNKSWQLAESLLKNTILLSFGDAMLHNKKLQEVFLNINLDSILLETDASETSIFTIYAIAAELKQMEEHVLQEQISTNFKRIFKK